MVKKQKDGWRVRKVLNKRQVNKKTQYLVRCEGQGRYKNIWLPTSLLANCYAYINSFQKSWKKRQKLQRATYLKVFRAIKKSRGQTLEELQKQIKQTKIDEKLILKPKKIALINLESEQSEKNQQFGQMKLMKRFDALEGRWFNVLYPKEQAENITILRNKFSLKEDCQGLNIKNIVSKNGVFIVQYERSNKKHQCTLQDFKFYCPQLLIDYLLLKYDPVNHKSMIQTTSKRISSSIIYQHEQLME